MNKKIYGYLRSSSGGAETSNKTARLVTAGIPAGDIFADEEAAGEADAAQTAARVSSASRGFPAFRTLLNRLEPGDTVAICVLDDLGCSAAQILFSMEQICTENAAALRVLSLEEGAGPEAGADSGAEGGSPGARSDSDAEGSGSPEAGADLDTEARGTAHSHTDPDTVAARTALILQVLRETVSAERKYRRKQQADGIAEARGKGIRFGRPSKALPDNYFHEYQKWRKGKTTIAEAAKACGMTPSRFYYQAKKFGKPQ